MLIVTASMRAASAACPSCNRLSQRVHSRYYRRVADLLLGGRAVQLQLVARRFRCDGLGRQRIFAERFGSTVPERDRRTGRMEEIVHHLGVASGGRLLICAERLQYEGYLRREETNAIVSELAANGALIKAIVRRTGSSRKLVRLIVRGKRTDMFRTRHGSLDPHLPFLDGQWEAGCRNGAELWRRLRALGFGSSELVVLEWATRRRRSERMTSAQLCRPPSARTIARLMTLKRDHLTRAETLTVAAINKGVPTLAETRSLVDCFQSIVHRPSSIVHRPSSIVHRPSSSAKPRLISTLGSETPSPA